MAAGSGQLRLRFFGGFHISWDDDEGLALSGKKSQALLAYLALNPNRRHTREKLATLLWGDRFDEQARHSLRQTLLDLRKTLEGGESPILVADDDEIAVSPVAIEVDVMTFQRLATDDNVAGWERASTLYSDNLLEGLNIPAEEFNAWLDGERVRLRELACDVLWRLSEHYCQTDRHKPAVEAVRHLLAIDPLREPAHRLLMALHESSGDRSAALKQYQICADALRRELDVDPEPETTRLYEEIRTQRRKPKRQKKSAITPSVSQTAIHVRRVRWRWVTAAVLAFLLVVTATTVASIYIWEKAPLIDEIKKGFMEPPLPSKPSIVVLPFENMSPDATHEFFSDGITADIIAELSRYPGLFVISRYSSFTYKDRTERIQTVATELGVQYVVEGTVQRMGPRIRISVQLIDATTGRHLWAGRLDRQVEDVFLLQDEVTQKIVASLAVEMSDAELNRIRRKDPGNLAAYEYVLRGRELGLRFTKESNERARRMYETAIALDPNYARALSYLAWTHLNDYSLGWSIDPRQSLMRAIELTKKAVALDPSNPVARAALGDAYLWTKRFDRAIKEYETAIALNPSDANNYAGMGDVLTWASKPKQAVEHLEKAIRLNPKYPFIYLWRLGHAYFVMEDYENALATLELLRERAPKYGPSYAYLAASYHHLGKEKEARAIWALVAQSYAGWTISRAEAFLPYKEREDMARVIMFLRAMGVPET